jgi:hypothetical protein
MPAQTITQQEVPSGFTAGILRSIEHISPVDPPQPSSIGRLIGISGALGLVISLIIIAGVSYINPPGELADLMDREEAVVIYSVNELQGKEPEDKMVSLSARTPRVVLSAEVAEVRDMGPAQFLDVIGGRDGAYSARFGDRSVWVFGDTFLNSAGHDGSNWRSSTWCWTQDFDAGDGIDDLNEPVDVKGAPGEFLPFTRGERAYNRIYNARLFPNHMRSRMALWPGPVVVSPAGDRAYVFYAKVLVRHGILNFETLGSSIALWEAPDKPVIRPEVRPDADDPTILFPEGDVDLGHGALVVDDWLYAYRCESRRTSWPCIIARVKFADALKRDAWEFFAGDDRWSEDWRSAVPVIDAAPALSVHWNEYLGKYLAVYTSGLANKISIRTAERPEGPWSRSRVVAECVPPTNKEIWSYSALAHPEFARDNGKVEYFTYYRETGPFTGEIRLVEVSFK